MDPRIVAFSANLIGLALWLAFVILFVWAIKLSWKGEALSKLSPEKVYVATILAGIVGNYVAKSFGQSLPDSPPPVKGQPGPVFNFGPTKNAVHMLLMPGFAGLAPMQTEMLLAQADIPGVGKGMPAPAPLAKGGFADYLTNNNFRKILVALYFLSYIIIALVSIATWISLGQAKTHDLVKNVACVSFGLFVAILGSILQ